MPTVAKARARWAATEARRWAARTTPPELGVRIYGSRLLGADPALVLAGGGNTSVKASVTDLHGRAVDALFVKASGADLATIDSDGFTPLALTPARELAELDGLADGDMVRELLRARLDPAAPAPSVEAVLHAFLPHRYVDHAHPDALLALLDTADGAARAEELYGDDCLFVPYAKPGFDLALEVRRRWRALGERAARLRGMVFDRHGLVAFADDPRQCYETLLELVDRAARRLPRRLPKVASRRRPPAWKPADVARLRQTVSRAAGRPMLLARRDERRLLAFLDRSDLSRVTQRGPLTSDHVSLTKRRPLVVSRSTSSEAAIEKFADAYRREFERLRRQRDLQPLDPAPRVVLVPGTGVFGVGRTVSEAEAAAEIYAHTAWAIARAEALGGYRPLQPKELFEVEYWELQQAKLARREPDRPLGGRIALVTGAASGIGRASAAALLDQGAVVVGLDLQPSELTGEFVGVEGDARSPRSVRRAIELAVRRFGGLDIVVANAGVFFAGPAIAELSDRDWRRTMALNLDAQLVLLREAAPLLALSPVGGAVVVVGSKNVAAPGQGAAAYSASKAALTQLARVAALEWAPRGVRVNVVHPDAVFDTGVWSSERLAERAANYGLTVEEYRRRNLLGREVAAADVGVLVAALAGDLFARTTGAQIPVDGGNERVI